MTFKLIESSNYFQTKALRDFLFLTLAVSLILLGNQKNGVAYYLGLPEGLIWYIQIIFVFSGVFVLIFYVYSRVTNLKGQLEISIQSIKIKKNRTSIVYDIQSLKDLKILHNSYVGQDYERSILNNFKGNNWIVISIDSKTEKFEFEIDSIYKSNQLANLAKQLEESVSCFEYLQT